MIEEKWWHKEVVNQIYPRSFLDGDGIGDLQCIIMWALKYALTDDYECNK